MSTHRRPVRAIVLNTMLGIALSCLPAVGRVEEPAAPNPVVQHFRAYTAAMQRQDFAGAETAAAAALDASVQAYGDGGRTAVLAHNLADVRLLRGNLDAAIAPAGKAFELAERQGATSGLDPRLARLTLDRARLRNGDAIAAQRLAKSLRAVAEVPTLAAMGYPGAVDLALFASEQKAYPTAENAWHIATTILQAQPNPNPMLLARAQIGEAAAGVLRMATLVKNYAWEAGNPAYFHYDEILRRTAEMLTPEAQKPGRAGEVTQWQSLYAQAMAWRSIVRSKVEWEGIDGELVEQKDPFREIGAERYDQPECKVRFVVDPPPKYPPRSPGDIGAVVVKVRADETGALEHWTIAAAVGGDSFVASVKAAVPGAHYEKKDAAESGCRVARETLVVFSYL